MKDGHTVLYDSYVIVIAQVLRVYKNCHNLRRTHQNPRLQRASIPPAFDEVSGVWRVNIGTCTHKDAAFRGGVSPSRGFNHSTNDLSTGRYRHEPESCCILLPAMCSVDVNTRYPKALLPPSYFQAAKFQRFLVQYMIARKKVPTLLWLLHPLTMTPSHTTQGRSR